MWEYRLHISKTPRFSFCIVQLCSLLKAYILWQITFPSREMFRSTVMVCLLFPDGVFYFLYAIKCGLP